MKYKIFGHWLQVDTNDDVLINALQLCAGHFAETEIETIGKVRFVKISTIQLHNYKIPIDGMRIIPSYVQPTKEYSTIYKSLDGEKVIHFYEHYYLIEYLYNSNLVEFYYTENVYKILDLLGEFLKYYIFEKALSFSECPLHSSCVVKKNSDKCFIFVGDSGCGKSSNALFATFNNNFEFMNDEITYITYCDGHLVSIPTTDKFKICEPMFFELKERTKIHFIKSNNEYLCDFQNSNVRSDKVYDIECLVVLVRDDETECIEKNCLSKLELYDLILRNLHFAFCNTKESKKLVMKYASKIMQECNVISIRYPTKLIQEVIYYI